MSKKVAKNLRCPSSSSGFRFPLREPALSEPTIEKDAPLGIGRESSGVAGELKQIRVREGGGEWLQEQPFQVALTSLEVLLLVGTHEPA